MKEFSIILILSLSQIALIGQSDTLEERMQEALSIHHNASTFADELKSAEILASISDYNPDEWLTAYWASFVYSQAGNAATTDKLKYFTKALAYFERAERQIEQLSSQEKSYLMALKALLASLHQTPYFIQGNQKKAMEFVSMQVEAFQKGLAFNQEEPTILVLMGISQIGAGLRAKPNRDLAKIAAGKALLLQAKSLFDEIETSSSLTPNKWNEGWIDVWLARTK